MNTQHQNLSSTELMDFYWADTAEGHSYWSRLYVAACLREGREVPTIYPAEV